MLLKVGVAGHAVGAVAWSVFWLAIAQDYVGMWWGYWFEVGLFVVSASLVMVGVGCFGLGKLFNRSSAVVTGVVNIVTAAAVFLTGLDAYRLLRLGSWLWFITLIGYGLLVASVFLWMAVTMSGVARSGHRRLRTATGLTSLVSGFTFLLSFALLRGGLRGLVLFTQPYVLAQVLSAVFLHRISSDTRRRLGAYQRSSP